MATCPEPPDRHPDPSEFDPTVAFLAGDYVELCPRCGSRASDYLAGHFSCGRCGAFWPERA